MKATIETERLLLRPWQKEDAAALYEYARDPRVGPAAGWPVHTSVEDSEHIIETVLAKDGLYAVTPKGGDGRPVGSAGLEGTTAPGFAGELEIGYWIGVPFWGRGLIPEAVRALLDMAFSELGQKRVWCAHYAGNEKSKRVIEKCGFAFAFEHQTELTLLGGEMRTALYYNITKEEYSAWKAT